MAYKMKSPYRMTGNIKPSRDPGEEKMGPKRLRLKKVSDLPGYDPKGFKGGTAPIAGGSMLKLGKKAVDMYKAFANTGKQYAKKQPKNMLSFVNQMKSKFGKRSTREKVTGMSDKFFKNVEKSFKNNPKLKKTSPGYYVFKK